MSDCDLAGRTYKGRYPGRQGYDGRLITVLGWCPLTDGYHCPQDGYFHERRVLCRDSIGRIWSTAHESVRAEIARQEGACPKCGSSEPAQPIDPTDPPAWACDQDPERCNYCGNLL